MSRRWLLFRRRGAPFCAFCAIAISGAAAPRESAQTARLLNHEEGRTIVSAAVQERVRGKPDCSHLVNRIYLLAGFAYPYASSFDLYAGNQNFRRVKSPQPGDLIIWPGHIGIVMDPVQHSFYSSVRTGAQAEFYDGPYWRARGKPRFYRYVLESPGGYAGARLQSASATETEARGAPARAIEDDSGISSSGAESKGKATPESTAAVSSAFVAGGALTAFDIPGSILIASAGGKPTADEVAQAISELSNAAGDVLRREDPLKPGLPVVIFDQFTVDRVETKGDLGWAHVRMDSEVSLKVQERAQVRRHHEEVRWELRRGESGWAAYRPSGRAFVPRDVAVRIFTQQLAQLANKSDRGTVASAATARQEAQLASLLDDLLNKNR